MGYACRFLMVDREEAAPVARRAHRSTYRGQAEGRRLPRLQRPAFAYGVAATGLPSASTTVTSPRLSARTCDSILDRSPTITQVSWSGSRPLAAALACSGVNAATSPLRTCTQLSGRP